MMGGRERVRGEQVQAFQRSPVPLLVCLIFPLTSRSGRQPECQLADSRLGLCSLLAEISADAGYFPHASLRNFAMQPARGATRFQCTAVAFSPFEVCPCPRECIPFVLEMECPRTRCLLPIAGV